MWGRRAQALVASCVLAVLPAVIPGLVGSHAGRGHVEAAARWIEIATPNFLLAGDVNEKELGRVARDLEQFRETLRRLLPKARVTTPVPTAVLVFGSQKSAEPFRPLYQGRPVDADGLFVGGRDVNYVWLRLDGDQEAYPVIFHEFTHLFLRDNLRNVPLWFSEGLAEFYSTFAVLRDGQQAKIGNAIPKHVYRLRDRFFTLANVLAADHSSPLYNREPDSETFYAESWAFIHYLMVGNPKRSGQLTAFVGRVSAGRPVDEAFREAFGAEPETLEKELRDYVHQVGFRAQIISFRDRLVAPGSLPPRAMKDAEVQARSGDLLLHMQRFDEAEARLQVALRLDPSLASAHVSLGKLRLRQGQVDAALESFKLAIERDPANHDAHYAYGSALLYNRSLHSGDDLVKARTLLARAVELRPDSPDTLAALAAAYLFDGSRPEEVRRLAERAVELAPSEDRHVLLLAQACLALGDHAAAIDRLGPLVARGETAEIRNRARELLAIASARRKFDREGR